jgi:hypothetical protein
MPGWSGWASLGGQLGGGTPVVGRNADGRLEVFALGVGAQGPELVHLWEDPTSATAWSGWNNLGSPPGQFMARWQRATPRSRITDSRTRRRGGPDLGH